MATKLKTIEDVLEAAGGNGRFQVIFVLLLTLPRFPIMWTMLEMSFANFVPQWCCVPEANTHDPHDFCYSKNSNSSMFSKTCQNSTSLCVQKLFATGINSVANEWELVCERKWMLPLTTSVQMGGVLAGAFLAGLLVDLIGRKKTFYMSIVLCGVCNIIAGFSVNWEMFTVFRFFIGLAIGGFLTVLNPYLMEFLTPSVRALPGLIPASQLGPALMALTAWRMPDWQWVHWIGGVITIPTALGYFFIPESMRWLAVKGRVGEAEEVVQQIAKWNRKPPPVGSLEVFKTIAAMEETTRTQTYTYIHLYKGWNLLKKSFILQLLWCILSMSAYGVSFSTAALKFNLYVNIFVMNVISIPFAAVLSCILHKWGRKKPAIVLLCISAACGFGNLISFSTVTDTYTRDIIINALSMLFRGTQTTAWSCIGIITNETYPTVMRGLASGAANVAARIGGVIAPFALNLEDRPALAFSLMGGLMAVSVVMVTFLEETTGKAMQDANAKLDLADAEEQKVQPDAYTEDGGSNKSSTSAEDDKPIKIPVTDFIGGDDSGWKDVDLKLSVRSDQDEKVSFGKDNYGFESFENSRL
ncbi:solute carrier family 22 member 7-like isoform X1 [Biomphalaria glabrata]|uniref:Solute carrier family 22 member 7-like isoform X1 n=1 Tax=Biomphalaria glabrata TaxID=6526 RepID=A0A9W3A027_BIOGL|nr:solute carrier family 22 member 7-like isoform X1 [Biomphalaria glabrata]